MKKNAKRLLCLALSLMLMLSVLSVAALAATPAEIVKAAYALATDQSMEGTQTLTGKITSINDPYNGTYKNVTVTILVEGCEDMPILCYRMKGEGADALAVNDIITVSGTLMNYKGTVEFAAGCSLDSVTSGGGEVIVAPTDPLEILKAAYALEKGAALPYRATLTGKIISVDSAYDESYKNITVTIAVPGAEGMPIECYRLKGEGAETLVVGNTITVSGVLKRYYKAATEDKAEVDKIEFDNGCTLDAIIADVVAPTDPVEIVKAAYALEKGDALPYKATLTGKIITVNEAYSEQYKNITVTIAVPGAEDMPIECYRMKGEGADALEVGDIITVNGTLKRYYKAATEDKPELDKIEFDTGCVLLSVGGAAPVTYEISFVVPQGVDAVEGVTCGAEGTTLPTAGTPDGYTFAGWTNAPLEDTTAAPVIYTGEYVPTADTTLYALYTYTVGGSSEGGWKLVTDVADLATGDSVVLAERGTGKVASEITKQYLSQVDATFSEDGTTLNLPEGAVVLTLTKSGSVWTMAKATGELLGATVVKKLAWNDGITSWSIAIDEAGVATITNADATYGRFLYNVNSPRFTTYTSNTSVTMVLPQLYKLQGEAGTTYYTTGKAAVEEPAGVTVSGNVVTGKSGNAGDFTVELKNDQSLTTVTGINGSYNINDVAAGTYTLTIKKENYVSRTYEITVGSEDVTLDGQICLLGDVNGNGRVEAGDVAKLFAYIKGGAALADDYALECANANGGKLNIGDVSRIYAHVTGKTPLF